MLHLLHVRSHSCFAQNNRTPSAGHSAQGLSCSSPLLPGPTMPPPLPEPLPALPHAQHPPQAPHSALAKQPLLSHNRLLVLDLKCRRRPPPTPCRVTAHFVPHKERSRPITTFMIKFEPSVMQRQAYLEAAKKG